MLLYHGSTEIIEFPKLIKSDRFLDFGNGFYTTTNLEQAIRWASIKKRRTEADTAYVSVYELDDSVLSDKNLSVLIFREADADWLEFITGNRRGNPQHKYDIVKGAVANDTIYQTLLLYEAGAYTVEDTITRLKVHSLFDQIAFHSEKALNKLVFRESVQME